MQRDEIAQLYRRMLLDLWSADDKALDDLVTQIAADDVVIHQNGEQQRGPHALAQLVRLGRGPFSNTDVEIEVGPLIDGDLVAARWSFSGDYAGGIPGATAPVGTSVQFAGIDLVRVEGGQVVEYWVCSDGAALMTQLGA